MRRVAVTTRDKAVAGHMDWEGGMSNASISVGRRTLEPEMKYSYISSARALEIQTEQKTIPRGSDT